MSDLQEPHEILKASFEQHWLHARHVEKERLVVLNVFAAILAGSFVYLKDDLASPSTRPALTFLIIFSLGCIAFSVKVSYIFEMHVKAAEELLQNLGYPLMLRNFSKVWVNTLMPITILFPLFFAVSFAFLLYFLLSSYCKSPIICILVAIAAVLVILVFVYMAHKKIYPEDLK